jgi:protocatechuate 3,4-dioxygenase beta subunit
MKYPMKTTETNRRVFLKRSLLGSALSLLPYSAYSREPTPKEVEGPFYPMVAQKDKDFDLTKVAGQLGVAKGKTVFIEGRVLDINDEPIENATVDLWQANAAGKYRHPHDSHNAPLDPNFQGWAIVKSGKDGFFRFKTIVPGAYPASDTWIRPPHIHFKVTKKGYLEIITQMYFPDHELNTPDLLMKRKSKKEQRLMIASKVKDKLDTLKYDIVLEKL